MSYGLKVINDDNYIQIDSDTPRLCAIYNGTYSAGSNTAIVTFPAPVTTDEPPCIFLRNDPNRNDELYDQMTISGGAGNWTGFTVRGNNVNWRPAGKWFVAVFASKAQAEYGMRLWGASGELVYDTGSTPVVVTKSNSSWSYGGVVQFPTLGAGYSFYNALRAPLATDEYFLMNPYSRGTVNTNGTYLWRGVRYNYSTQRLEMYIIANPGNPPQLDQGQCAALYARLPGT